MKFRQGLVWCILWSLLLSVILPASIASAETPPAGLADPLNDFKLVYQRSNMYTIGADSQYFGGDTARATRTTTANGHLIYKTAYDIQSFTAFSYAYTNNEVPFEAQRFYASADGTNYTALTVEPYLSGAPNANWQLYIYETFQVPTGTRYLKVEFRGSAKSWSTQLSKLVINQNVASVTADPPTGLVGDEPFQISLSTPSDGARIYYKSQKDTEYKLYSGPISITEFTVLDTKAMKDGWEQSPVRTYTYFSKKDMVVDRYGQKISAQFPDKVTKDEELAADVAADEAYYGSLQAPAAFDELGGLKGSKESLGLTAKGFFSIQKNGDQPILVAPNGNAYFSLGVNGITNNETFTLVKGREQIYEWIPPYDSEYRGAFQGSKDVFSYYMANKLKKTGSIPSSSQFFKEAVDRIKKWGFNSAGAWGSGTMSSQNGLPYTLVLPLNGMGKPAEIKVFDIFADGAESKIDAAFASMLPNYKNDPLLIGYFVDNEYHYEKFLQTVPRLKASKTGLKKRLVQMLQEKYGDIAAFNTAWGTSFAGFTDLNETALYIDTAEAAADIEAYFHLYLDTYYSTVSRLFKKYDPNHLLLGDRWLTVPMQNIKVRSILAEEAGKYMDVISINHYSRDLDITMLNEVHAKSGGKPILLSEWSYGTAEQGLNPIVAGAATTEQERQWRYRNYVEGAAALGYVVGTHWFDYVDQAATGRWFEGLNGESYNTGLINVADRPYKTFLAGAMETHNNVYDVMLGKKPPFKHSFGTPGGGTGKNLTMDIPYASAPVPVDGEWNGIAEGTAGKATLTLANRVSLNGTGGNPITADYAFAWDEAKLYVTAKVNDPTPMKNNFQNSNIWKGDGLEMFFGPSELQMGGDLQFDDRQIILSAGVVNGTNYWLWFNTGRQTPVNMAVKALPDGSGYVLDAAIPWDALRMQPVAGREFLFDFGFDDSEDGANRKQQYVWNGTSKNNANRGLWGRATLSGRTQMLVEPAAGVYSDPTALSASLSDQNGAPVAGAQVKFLVNGQEAGAAVTDAAGKAQLAYTVLQGAGTYAVQAVFEGGHSYSGTAAEGILQVVKESADLLMEAPALGTGGAPVPVGVQVKELEDGSPGSLEGLSVIYSVYGILPDGTRAAVPGLEGGISAVTDSSGKAVWNAELQPGLYEIAASLGDNSRYVTVNASPLVTTLAVLNPSVSGQVKVKGYADLPEGSIPGLAAGRLHVDVDATGGTVKKWTLQAGGVKLDVQTDWSLALPSDGSLYLQGRLELDGKLATVLLMARDGGGTSDRISLEIQAGESEDSFYNLEFAGNIRTE